MYNDIFSCQDKVAIITGGNGLIGRELVKALSEFGAAVYIADIEQPKIESFVQYTEIKFVYLDVTSEDSVITAFSEVIKDAGQVDILINCAYPRTKDWGVKFEQIPFESWKKNVNDHLGGYFLCCQKAAQQMKQQKRGSIINFASIYGTVAPDFSMYAGTEMTMPAAYAAIKGGIITFTKYLATYYAQYNVRANVISPGGIFDHQPPPFVEQYTRRTPLGRMGNPGDIVGAVIYLASDASAYVTGHNLVVDGGWTVW